VGVEWVVGVRLERVAVAETIALRQRVLRPSLTVRDVETARDRDVDTVHVIARLLTGEVVGTGTVIKQESPWGESGWRLRWMAVDAAYRRCRVGARLLAELVEHAGAGGGGILWCNARLPAVPFYERAGFAVRGEPWDDPDAGPTVVMWREASRPKGRDADFTAATRRVIAMRAGWRCSHPTCGRATVGPGAGPDSVVDVGVAAHIYASSKEGPRGAGGLDPEQRASVANGIWLCSVHARLIDANRGDGFPPDLLASWRDLREARATLDVGGQPSPAGWVESLKIRGMPKLGEVELYFGRRTAIVGGNGSGKSTLVDLLLGANDPDRVLRYTARGPNIGVDFRCYAPAPTTFSYLASHDRLTFTVDSTPKEFPILPFEVVEIRFGWYRTVQELAGGIGLPVSLLPNILEGSTRLPTPVLGRLRESLGRVIRWEEPLALDFLSADETIRLSIELGIRLAAVKSEQRATILLVDGLAERYSAPTTMEYLAGILEAEPFGFQVIVTSRSEIFPASGEGWEVINLPRRGGVVRSYQMPRIRPSQAAP